MALIWSGGGMLRPTDTRLRVGTNEAYSSVKTAVEAATSGQIVYVQPGSYSESPFTIPAGVTLAGANRDTVSIVFGASPSGGAAGITFAGSSTMQDIAVINNGGGTNPWNLLTFSMLSGGDAVVNRCRIQCNDPTVQHFASTSAGTYTSAATATFRDCEFVNMPSYVMVSAGGAKNLLSQYAIDCTFTGWVGTNGSALTAVFDLCHGSQTNYALMQLTRCTIDLTCNVANMKVSVIRPEAVHTGPPVVYVAPHLDMTDCSVTIRNGASGVSASCVEFTKGSGTSTNRQQADVVLTDNVWNLLVDGTKIGLDGFTEALTMYSHGTATIVGSDNILSWGTDEWGGTNQPQIL